MDYLRWVLVRGSRSAGIPLKDISTLVALPLLLHPEAGSLCHMQAPTFETPLTNQALPLWAVFLRYPVSDEKRTHLGRVLMSPKPEQPPVRVINSWDSSGGSRGHSMRWTLEASLAHSEYPTTVGHCVQPDGKELNSGWGSFKSLPMFSGSAKARTQGLVHACKYSASEPHAFPWADQRGFSHRLNQGLKHWRKTVRWGGKKSLQMNRTSKNNDVMGGEHFSLPA